MVINDAHKSILSPHGFPLVQFQLWTCKKRSRDVRHRARTIIWTGNREHRQSQFDTYVTCLTYVLLIIRTCPKHCKCSELGKTIPGSNRAPLGLILPTSKATLGHGGFEFNSLGAQGRVALGSAVIQPARNHHRLLRYASVDSQKSFVLRLGIASILAPRYGWWQRYARSYGLWTGKIPFGLSCFWPACYSIPISLLKQNLWMYRLVTMMQASDSEWPQV